MPEVARGKESMTDAWIIEQLETAMKFLLDGQVGDPNGAKCYQGHKFVGYALNAIKARAGTPLTQAQAGNSQSAPCICKLENMPHFKSTSSLHGVESVSLSLTVNKECPVHGCYFK